MTVTDILDHKSKKVKVYLDDEFAFVLYKGELSKCGITAGGQISESVYEHIIKDILVKRARLYCLKLLTARAYSETALRTKLEEALYPAAVTEDAMEYVKSFGYVDDEQYASDLYESLSGRYPAKVIMQKMRQKGISDEVIARCMQNVGDTSESENELIIKLIKKKCRGVYPQDQNEEARLMRYLSGKGFSYSQIKNALDHLT